MSRIATAAGLLWARRTDQLWYAAWKRLRRLDLGYSSLQELGLSRDRSKGYADSGGPDLASVLRSVEIPPGSRVLDLGSGKGGAVFTLCAFPFVEVVGLEISRRLIDVAAANAARLALDGRVRWICADAGEYGDLDRFTHFYMFNPFPPRVAREVMSNVARSVRRRPRTVTWICATARGDPSRDPAEDGIDERLFTELRELRFPMDHVFRVYTRRDGGG